MAVCRRWSFGSGTQFGKFHRPFFLRGQVGGENHLVSFGRCGEIGERHRSAFSKGSEEGVELGLKRMIANVTRINQFD